MDMPKHFAKKYWIIIAVAVVVLLAGVGVTWFGLHESQKFEQAVDESGQQVARRIAIADSKLSGEDKTPKNTEVVLQNLQSYLAQYEVPQPTNILGLKLAKADVTRQAEDLQVATTAAAKELKKSLTLLQYQQTAAASLAKSNNLKAANGDELKAVAEVYKTTTAELIAMRPPASLADFHTKLTQTSLAISNGVAKMPELYIAQDVDGFKAQNAQIGANIDVLRALHDSLLKELQSQDEDLASALKELR